MIASSPLRERVLQVSLRLGERLLFDCFADDSAERGLAGAAGAALAFDALSNATGDERYAEASRKMICRAARTDDVPGLGLFVGVSGLRAVAALLKHKEAPYGKLVAQCDAFVDSKLPDVTSVEVLSHSDFDVISGWSGVRLARCVLGRRPEDRLTELLAWLVEDPLRWRCVHPVRRGEPENDLGVAHGIAGVIGAVSLTTEPNHRLRALLKRSAEMLIEAAVRLPSGANAWPHHLQAEGVARPGWCYGTPGVAAALFWFADRFYEERVKVFALSSLERIAQLPLPEWQLPDLGLCHGVLGNALVFASVGSAANSERLLHSAMTAVEFATVSLERSGGACWTIGADGLPCDSSRELDGAVGIVLALLTLLGLTNSSWLRLHVLAPIDGAP